MAKRLDISNQAVSKWETEQSYPDIELLPKIADIFDITLEELFGRKFEQEKDVLDWQDDTLYAVVFRGSKLIRREELDENLNQICNNITLEYSGEIRNIESSFNVICGDVGNDVHAGSFVECGDVGGMVEGKVP